MGLCGAADQAHVCRHHDFDRCRPVHAGHSGRADHSGDLAGPAVLALVWFAEVQTKAGKPAVPRGRAGVAEIQSCSAWQYRRESAACSASSNLLAR